MESKNKIQIEKEITEFGKTKRYRLIASVSNNKVEYFTKKELR